MLIRPEKESEFDRIYDLVKEAFRTAKVSSGDEQNFVTRLRAGENYVPKLALVAEDKGVLIGHVMLTRTIVKTEIGLHPVLLLAPLAVALERRSEGIGAALVYEAFRRAVDDGYKAVVLVGDPAYYARFGFKCSEDFGVRNTDGIPAQYVMMCELAPGALKDVTGTISFEH